MTWGEFKRRVDAELAAKGQTDAIELLYIDVSTSRLLSDESVVFMVDENLATIS